MVSFAWSTKWIPKTLVLTLLSKGLLEQLQLSMTLPGDVGKAL
jgi:hypothetical protein